MNRLEKLFHRHNWVYIGYVPYGYKGYPKRLWGTAQSRRCEKCGLQQNKW